MILNPLSIANTTAIIAAITLSNLLQSILLFLIGALLLASAFADDSKDKA